MRTPEQKSDQAAKQRARRLADPEKFRLRNQVQHRLYRQRHPDLVRAKQRAYYLANQEAIRAQVRSHYALTRDAAQAQKRRAMYGLDRAGYEALLTSQHGLCAICRRPETRIRVSTGLVMRLAVDHDHATGRIRGLLCWRCNTLLAQGQDDANRLRYAAQYLEGSPE